MSIGSPITLPSWLLSENQIIALINSIFDIIEDGDQEDDIELSPHWNGIAVELGSIEDISLLSLHNELMNRDCGFQVDERGRYYL